MTVFMLKFFLKLMLVLAACAASIGFTLWAIDPCSPLKPDRLQTIERDLYFTFPPSAENIGADCLIGTSTQFDIAPSDVCTFIDSTFLYPDQFRTNVSELQTDPDCRQWEVSGQDKVRGMESYLYAASCGSPVTQEYVYEVMINTGNPEQYRASMFMYRHPRYGVPTKTEPQNCDL